MSLGRICPGCKRIVTGPCPCRPGGKRATARRQRNHKVYATAAHKQQRRRILKRDGFKCVDCGHVDETGRSLVADHIRGIDAQRAFDDSELATRCLICSGRKDGARGQAIHRGQIS